MAFHSLHALIATHPQGISLHAGQRSEQRHVSFEDLKNVATSGTSKARTNPEGDIRIHHEGVSADGKHRIKIITDSPITRVLTVTKDPLGYDPEEVNQQKRAEVTAQQTRQQNSAKNRKEQKLRKQQKSAAANNQNKPPKNKNKKKK